jgi:hypothetical protein
MIPRHATKGVGMADRGGPSSAAEAARRRAEFERIKNQRGMSTMWKVRLVIIGVVATLGVLLLALPGLSMLLLFLVSGAIARPVWRWTRTL